MQVTGCRKSCSVFPCRDSIIGWKGVKSRGGRQESLKAAPPFFSATKPIIRVSNVASV